MKGQCPACQQPFTLFEDGGTDDMVRCGCTVVSLEWLRLAVQASTPAIDDAELTAYVTEAKRVALEKTAPLRELAAAAESMPSEAPRMPSEAVTLLDKHIQRSRDAVFECPNWSPAQAEWSRARDALLNYRDDLMQSAFLRHATAALDASSVDRERMQKALAAICACYPKNSNAHRIASEALKQEEANG